MKTRTSFWINRLSAHTTVKQHTGERQRIRHHGNHNKSLRHLTAAVYSEKKNLICAVCLTKCFEHLYEITTGNSSSQDLSTTVCCGLVQLCYHDDRGLLELKWSQVKICVLLPTLPEGEPLCYLNNRMLRYLPLKKYSSSHNHIQAKWDISFQWLATIFLIK